MIEFRLSRLNSGQLELKHPADAYIGVTGRLELVADGKTIYDEDDFPVLELGAELGDWLRTGLGQGCDFIFDSMSTPESGWIWIRRFGTGWRVGSLHQAMSDPAVHGDSDIQRAVELYLESLRRVAASDLGADISHYLEGHAP